LCRPSKKEIGCRSRISFSVFQQCEKFAGLPSVDESVVYVERYGHRKPIAGPSQFPGGDAGYGVAPIGRPGMFHFRKGEPGNSRKIDKTRAPGMDTLVALGAGALRGAPGRGPWLPLLF